ncbi:MAG: ATP synthase F1 subunit delta [Spirochaetales bacterium]|nr:ATP synthase F1 subunit delta [Spirochaetales bacterium]
MKNKFTPRRYAQALYEVAAENNSLESVTKDMLSIRKIFNEAPQIREYCLQFHGDRGSDMDFIETALFPYIGHYTKELLKIALKNNRISMLPFLPGAFDLVRDEKNDTVTVTVESAHVFPDEMISLLSEKMRKRINKTIKIETIVNLSLLGGFRIHWKNHLIDQSVAGRLKKIRNLLGEGI